MSQEQQPANVPAEEAAKEQPKKYTGYRVQQEKRIEINKSHTNRRERAEVLKVLSIGLFGRRRYRNMYLVSSLNNFYHALMIANTLQKRVEKLALIINMEKVKYTEFQNEESQGVQKQYSTFVIKITKQPTEQDKKNIGFNEGQQKIQNPLTQVISFRRNQRRGGDQRRGGQRRNNQRRGERTGERRGERRGGERQDRRTERRDDRRTERRDDRRQNRGGQRRQNRGGQRRQPRQEGRTQQRRENRNYQRRDYRRQNNERTNQKRNYISKDKQEEYFDRRRGGNYRKDKHQKVEDDDFNRRGQKRTRGQRGQQQTTRVADHEYKQEHLNRNDDKGTNYRKQEDKRQDRRQDRKQDRRERAPRRNRYSSDDEY